MDKEIDLLEPGTCFSDEEKARELLEALRWGDRPVCPHCSVIRNAYKLRGKSTRPGLYKCRRCRKPFTVTVGTIFEGSRIPLNKWLLAYHLLCVSEKGMSPHQLHEMLKITYRSARSMARRIRHTIGHEPLRWKLDVICTVENHVRDEFREPPTQVVRFVGRQGDRHGRVISEVSLISELHPDGRLQHRTDDNVELAEATNPLRYLDEHYSRQAAPKKVQGQELRWLHDQAKVMKQYRGSQPEPRDQQRQPSRVTNSKPVSHIPLPFADVIADVLKMKPPAKGSGAKATSKRKK
jgi:transposase-like protein